MPDTLPPVLCVNCHRSEQEAPIVSLRYRGQPAWICSGCLPILIHHPEQLADQLPGARAYAPDESPGATEA